MSVVVCSLSLTGAVVFGLAVRQCAAQNYPSRTINLRNGEQPL